jgi:hypothetical protein
MSEQEYTPRVGAGTSQGPLGAILFVNGSSIPGENA